LFERTGILKARDDWDAVHNPHVYDGITLTPAQKKNLTPAVNTGLSQIVTRSGEINPHWKKTKAGGSWQLPMNADNLPIYQIDKERKRKRSEILRLRKQGIRQ